MYGFRRRSNYIIETVGIFKGHTRGVLGGSQRQQCIHRIQNTPPGSPFHRQCRGDPRKPRHRFRRPCVGGSGVAKKFPSGLRSMQSAAGSYALYIDNHTDFKLNLLKTILILFFLSMVGACATDTYCAKKYKVLFCYGNWGVDQQSEEFKKHRRLCLRQSKSCVRFGVKMWGFGGCYPEYDIRAMEECYQDCMERHGYKLWGLSNKMLNTLYF